MTHPRKSTDRALRAYANRVSQLEEGLLQPVTAQTVGGAEVGVADKTRRRRRGALARVRKTLRGE